MRPAVDRKIPGASPGGGTIPTLRGDDDIYDSRKRLLSALSALSVNSAVSEENKEHIRSYIRYNQAQGIKAIRLRKTVYMLRDIATILQIPFQLVERKDIEFLLCEIESRPLSQWTKSDYRIILKRFYKWLLGNNETYPENVRWVRNKEPKNDLLPEELLSESEVVQLVQSTKFMRDKAFIYLLYESGARIGEILTLKLKNITFGSPLSSILVNGKTGQRRIPILRSVDLLKHWVEEHPFRGHPDALVWVKLSSRKGNLRKQGSNDIFSEVSYSLVKKMLKQTFLSANIHKRHHPHLFRHSRATFLAKHLTEAQLKQFFGWTQASDMAARYVHLSGRDIDAAMERIYLNPI